MLHALRRHPTAEVQRGGHHSHTCELQELCQVQSLPRVCASQGFPLQAHVPSLRQTGPALLQPHDHDTMEIIAGKQAHLYLPSRWHKNLKFPKQPFWKSSTCTRIFTLCSREFMCFAGVTQHYPRISKFSVVIHSTNFISHLLSARHLRGQSRQNMVSKKDTVPTKVGEIDLN